jgi:NADH:ubiquinone oxidoreductase subunit 6 (subunit J)
MSLLSATFWISVSLTVAAAVLATFVSDVRRAVIALWLCGLGMGGIFLSVGAELLAITQWIVSTLVVISFIFYAVMFGEFGVSDERPLKARLQGLVMPLIAGAAFAAAAWIGAGMLHGDVTAIEAPTTTSGSPTAEVGRRLTEENWLSLEVLGLTLFLVIVGSGIVARPEVRD